MNYIAHINIMPHKALLDPQGKAVTQSMTNIGLPQISNVRIGKHITLQIDAASVALATTAADDACKKLLCNQIMEEYSITITEE